MSGKSRYNITVSETKYTLKPFKLYIYMRYKYPIKFKKYGSNRRRYVKARSLNEAYTKLLNDNRADSITSIALDGQPVPTTTNTAAQLVKRQNKPKDSRIAQLQGMFKYYDITGKSVFDK